MIKIAITQGDINGIGYEVILKCFQDTRMLELCTPVLYGSSRLVTFYRKLCQLPQIPVNIIETANDARNGVLNIVETIPADIQPQPGADTPEGGKAAMASLEAAVSALRSGEVDALVTAPINKHNIQSETFIFAGHTEYLEASLGDGDRSLMILFNERMRIALATTHLPVSHIAEAITVDSLVDKLRIFNNSLKQDFSIVAPRIAVLALNPHAGDNGLLGAEENDIIVPAINAVRDEKILAFGPYPADGFFGAGNFDKFDGILAMYHDQGLAPFKTMAMDSGVNFTAGLKFVRTSPDHGTVYDIAGQGVASEQSMRQAIYAAIDIVRSRLNHAEATANPLRRSKPTETNSKKPQ